MIYPPNQKPPIWSIDPGVIAYNCQKAGMPHPVGAWPMWEGAGDRIVDYSGYGKTGTLAGSGGKWVVGGFDFEDTSYFSLDKRPVYGISGNSITIQAIVRFDAFENFVYPGIVKSTNSDMGATLRLGQPASDIEMYMGDGAAYHFFTYAHGMSTNKWYDIIGIYDGSKGEIFVGEVGGGISSVGSTIDSFTPNWGTEALTNRYISDDDGSELDGSVAVVNIFPSNLTTSQVKFLHCDPYFLYQIPEELYGYVTAVAGISIPSLMQQMNQFDGGTYALC